MFKTSPAADDDGFISGDYPLTVSFNNCQSRPGDEDDDLKFTFDFDADGTVDLSGPCRATFTYGEPSHARVCVSDRRPGNEVCQTWTIRVLGGLLTPPPAVTPRPTPGSGGGPTPTPTPSATTVTSITFTMDNVNCGATQNFAFYLNGVLLGAPASGAPCMCGGANVESFTFDSPSALAAWNNGGANTIRFVKPEWFDVSPAVAYISLRADRSNGTSLTSCLFDSDGLAPCAGSPPTCVQPSYTTAPMDASFTVMD
jgi:hypothetical protein